MKRGVRRETLSWRLARFAVCALLLPLAARAAAGQATPPPPADSGFEVVEVDLNGQTFTRVLPFDVPFILTGAVPQGVTSLEVRCWKLATENGKKGGKPILVTAARLHDKPEGDCWDGGALVWRNTIDPTAPNPKFRLLAPRLDAEQFYQFKFSFEKKVTPQEAEAFAQRVQGIVDAALWGNPQEAAELPLAGDLTVPEINAIGAQLIQALQAVTGADRFPEPGTIFSKATPFEAVRNEFNQLLQPVRNAQGQIVAADGDYQDEVANLNSLLEQVRNDPTLRRLRDALAGNASVQAQADAVAAALGLANAPVLSRRDRESAAALSAFVAASEPYFTDAAAKTGRLRDLLANKLLADDGAPQPFLAPLVAAGRLSREDLSSLAAMGRPRGLVGSADRSLSRAGGILANRLQGLLAERTQAVATIARQYKTKVQNLILIAGSTTGSFETQSRNYISADAGVACAPQLSSCSTYLGTNIYFRPINKAAPLNQFGGFFQTLDRRVSVTLGLTVQGIGDGGKTREDLFGNQSLILGLGARLTNSVRLTAGSVVFKKLSPNPLSTDTKLTTTYFLSFSFDIDVVPTLAGIGGLFKP
ncbi:MAG TPA: hypothetical protein VGH73_08420 [Thermoanaerobaculia bacterium]